MKPGVSLVFGVWCFPPAAAGLKLITLDPGLSYPYSRDTLRFIRWPKFA
jgi:hypothetical protein